MSQLNRIELDDPNDFLEWRRGHGGTIEIVDIVVRSERRKGRGRLLVQRLFAELNPHEHVYAITRAENRIAQEFYHALGFRCVAPLFDFYGNRDNNGDVTIDAVMYGRKVKGPI